MKKIVLAVLFLPVLAFGQAKDEPLVDRYYTGLGFRLGHISETTKSVYFREDLVLNNENGEFTDAIYISQIARNSPASRWFRSGDIITGFGGDIISGSDYVEMNDYSSLEHFIERVKEGKPGDSIWIEIKRLNSEDQSWNKYGVHVPRAKIDNIAFGLIDIPLTSSLCSGDECISFQSCVHHDRERGGFIYDYRITNDLSQKVFIRTDLTDIAIGGWFPSSTFIILEPGESRDIILRTEFFPVEHYGEMEVLGINNDEMDIDYLKSKGISIPGDMEKVISLNSGSTVSGFVPAEYLEVRKRRGIQ